MKHVIFSAYKQAFYRVRAQGEVADFWQPDPERATVYPDAKTANAAIEATCSSLTRHMTYPVTLREARNLAIGHVEAREVAE